MEESYYQVPRERCHGKFYQDSYPSEQVGPLQMVTPQGVDWIVFRSVERKNLQRQTGNLAHPCLRPGKRLVSGKCSINICYTNRWMEWIVLNGIKSLTIINVFVEHPSDKLHSMWALGWHLRISQWSKKITWGPLTASESRVTSPRVMGSPDSHKCHNSHREIEMIDVMSPGLPPHICEPQMAG